MSYCHYYINKNAQSSGEHEIHKRDCAWLPENQNCQYLGYFDSFIEAKKEALKYFKNIDGCFYCCKTDHTK